MNARRCVCCGKFFSQKRVLKCHMETHLPEDQRPFKCSICSKGFTTGYKLKSHARGAHSDESEKKFVCNQCGYK